MCGEESEIHKLVFLKMVMYISWLDCHPDKMEAVGSSPTITTTNKPSFLRGIPIVEATLKN